MRTVQWKPLRRARYGAALASAMLALIVVPYTSVPTQAAIEDASFELNINRELSCLPSSPSACSNPNMFGSQISRQNNMPFLHFENTSADAAISEFRMSIGNTAYHFGSFGSEFVNIAYNPSNRTITSMATDGDELVLKFEGGLQRGQFVHFQIDIDRDSCPDCGRPAFHNVLFNQNGKSTTGRSMVTVTYTMEGMDPLTQGPTAWANQPINPHVGRNYAPYALSASLNGPVNYSFSTGPPDITEPPGEPTIPEPGAGVLAILGLAVAWCSGLSRPRRGRG